MLLLGYLLRYVLVLSYRLHCNFQGEVRYKLYSQIPTSSLSLISSLFLVPKELNSQSALINDIFGFVAHGVDECANLDLLITQVSSRPVPCESVSREASPHWLCLNNTSDTMLDKLLADQ